MSANKGIGQCIGVTVNKELVKKLNKEAVPGKFNKIKKWYPNVNLKEISIGSMNPVMDFKEWSKNTFDKIKGE